MAEKEKEGSVTLLNRGQRHFDVGTGTDGKPRRHSPGTTFTYSADEAKRLSGYRELVDISKLPGQVDTAKLKAENAKLLDENKRLREQLIALQAPKDEPKPSKEDSKKSK